MKSGEYSRRIKESGWFVIGPILARSEEEGGEDELDGVDDVASNKGDAETVEVGDVAAAADASAGRAGASGNAPNRGRGPGGLSDLVDSPIAIVMRHCVTFR